MCNALPFRRMQGAVLVTTRPGMLQLVILIDVHKHPTWHLT